MATKNKRHLWVWNTRTKTRIKAPLGRIYAYLGVERAEILAREVVGFGPVGAAAQGDHHLLELKEVLLDIPAD